MLSIDRVAELLDCSRRTIQRLADAGNMPLPVRFGRLVRWRENDINDWIADGCPKRTLTNQRAATKSRGKR
ncbi:helix-turn-helix transcriptional regulator [Stieleria tagensis]|uniref:helix-turn-helix transcriptional regulator n=1 Tax=Stieleria tagensis TaxID=2956795 RepID=UPI0036F23A14